MPDSKVTVRIDYPDVDTSRTEDKLDTDGIYAPRIALRASVVRLLKRHEISPQQSGDVGLYSKLDSFEETYEGETKDVVQLPIRIESELKNLVKALPSNNVKEFKPGSVLEWTIETDRGVAKEKVIVNPDNSDTA